MKNNKYKYISKMAYYEEGDESIVNKGKFE